MADNKFIKTLEENFEKSCESSGFQYKNKINNDEKLEQLLKVPDINFIPTRIFAGGYKIKNADLAKKFLEVNFDFIKKNKDHLTDLGFKSYFRCIDDKTKMALASTLTEDWPGKKNITDVFKLYYQNTDIKFSKLVEAFGGERGTNYNKQILKELLNGPNRVVSSIKNNLENTIEIEKISSERFSEIIDYITDEKNPIPMGHVGGPDSVGFVYMILRRREKISFDDLCRILSFFANNDKEFFDRLSHNIGYVDHCYFDAKVGEKIKDQETIFINWLLQKVDGKLETDKASTKKILFRFFDNLYKTGDEKTQKVLDIMKCNGDLLAVKNDYDKFIKFKKSLESVCNKKSNTEFLFDESNIDNLFENVDTSKMKFEYNIPEYMNPEEFFYENKIFSSKSHSDGIVGVNQLKKFMEMFKLNYYPLCVIKSGKLEDHETFRRFVETNISFIEKSVDADFYCHTPSWLQFEKILKIYDWKKSNSKSYNWPNHYGGGIRLNSDDKDLIDRLVNIFIKSGSFDNYDADKLNGLVYNVKLSKDQFEQIWNLMEKNNNLYFDQFDHLRFCPEDQLINYVKKLLAVREPFSSRCLDPEEFKNFLTLGSSLETKIEIINCILEEPNIIGYKSIDFLEKVFFNENGCFISFDAKNFDNKTHEPRKYNEAEKKIILEARPKFQIKLLEYKLRGKFKGCTLLKGVIEKFETAIVEYKNDKKMILMLKSIAVDSFVKLLSRKDFKSKFDFFELDNGLYGKLGLFDGDLSDDQRKKLADALVFNIKNDSATGELVDEYKKSIDAKINLLKKIFGDDLSVDLINKLKSKIMGTGITSKYILGELDKITKDNKKEEHDENYTDEQKNIAANKAILEGLQAGIDANEGYKKILLVDDLPKDDPKAPYEYYRRLRSRRLYNKLKSDENLKIAPSQFKSLVNNLKSVLTEAVNEKYNVPVYNRLQKKLDEAFKPVLEKAMNGYGSEDNFKWQILGQCVAELGLSLFEPREEFEKKVVQLENDIDKLKFEWQNNKMLKDSSNEFAKDNKNEDEHDKNNTDEQKNIVTNKIKLEELEDEIKNNSDYEKCLSNSKGLKNYYDALSNDENLKKDPKIFEGLISNFKDKLDGFVNQDYNNQSYNELLEKFNEVFKGGEEAAEKNGELAYFSALRYNIFESWYLANQPKDVFKKEVDNWKDTLNEYELMRENKKNGKDDISVLTGYRAENKKKLKKLIDEYKNSGDENKIKVIKINEIESKIEKLKVLVYILSDQNNFEYELKELRSKIDKIIGANKNKEQKVENNNSELLNFANGNNINLNQAAEFNKKDVFDIKNNSESESKEKEENKNNININILADTPKEFVLNFISLFCEDKNKDTAKRELQALLEDKALMDSVTKSKELKTCINEFEKTLLDQKENIKKAADLSDKDLEDSKVVLQKLGEAKNNYNKSDEAQKKRIGFSLGIPGAATIGLGIASVFFPPALIGLAIAGTVTGVSGVTEFCIKIHGILKSHQMKFVLSKIKPMSDVLSKYLDKRPKSNIENQIKNNYGIRN